MTVLNSPPLISGGASQPANGRVTVAPTQRFTWGSNTVELAPQGGIIRAGEFYAADGESPLELVPTPLGVGMHIVLYLEVPTGTGSREFRVERTVIVPDATSVAWAYMDDFAPVDDPATPGGSGEGFGLDAFGTGPFGM